MKTQILYVFHEVNDNVKNFIDNAIFESDKYKFTFIYNKPINSNDILPYIPSYVNLIVRDNEGYDFAAFGHALFLLKEEYDYYLFINSSVAGPCVDQDQQDSWPNIFTSELNDTVKLYGCTINNYDEYGSCKNGFFHHVQSFCFCLDKVSLKLCLDNNIFEDKKTFVKTVINCELAMSSLILKSGYNIGSRMTRYKNIDFRTPEKYQKSLFISDCMYIQSFIDAGLTASQVVFVKTNRDIPSYIYKNLLLKREKKECKEVAMIMMVKNEQSGVVKTIQQYVESGFKNFFIFDTGSEDNTVSLAREYLSSVNVNYIIKEEKFINFAESRNKCLDYARDLFPNVEYSLFTDCEWDIINCEGILEFCKNIKDPKDAYGVYIKSGYTVFSQPRLFRNLGNARYKGRVHESVSTSSSENIPQTTYFVWNQSLKGQEKTVKRWYRDLSILLEEYDEEKKRNDLSPRTVFYLAQSAQCLDKFELAIQYYTERVEMKNEGFQEEKFIALYRLGQMYHGNKNQEKSLFYFTEAYKYRPTRIEPLVHLSANTGNSYLKYMYSKQACSLPFPANDCLFVDKHLYDFERWNQLAISSWYTDHYDEGWIASKIAYNSQPDNKIASTNYALYKKKMCPDQSIIDRLNESKKNVKILNLILYSTKYKEMYDILSEYLKFKKIDHYFYCYDENISEEYKIVDDIFYIKGTETFLPGILDKTVYILDHFKDYEYDYIIRSNASTLINFDLLNQSLIRTNIDYGGPLYYSGNPFINPSYGITEEFLSKNDAKFASGICIILSKKAINCILENKQEMRDYNVIDDVAIGTILNKHFSGTMGSFPGKVAWNKDEYQSDTLIYRNNITDIDKTADRSIDIKNMKKIALLLKFDNTKNTMIDTFLTSRNIASNFNEHVKTLYDYCEETSSCLHLSNETITIYPILTSLANRENSSFVSITNNVDNEDEFVTFINYCEDSKIKCKWIFNNEMKVIDEGFVSNHKFDLLMIDSMHTYQHVSWQLETLSSCINKYIILHDTEAPYGRMNDISYKGDYSEYSKEIDRSKVGVMTAVEDFLDKNKEWKILQRKTNNYGLVVLHRVK